MILLKPSFKTFSAILKLFSVIFSEARLLFLCQNLIDNRNGNEPFFCGRGEL
jgi:hypothetical protein